ncbi:MAG: hypothetical protein MI861_13825, partial [Pirellulales bacterium]|nr:hypothetical protein [Pirellulales bacterium]
RLPRSTAHLRQKPDGTLTAKADNLRDSASARIVIDAAWYASFRSFVPFGLSRRFFESLR